jgi:hypothetical protein
MSLQFQPPFAINPNARSNEQQGLDNINHTLDTVSNDWIRQGELMRRDKREASLLDLQRDKDAREAEVHRYEYGDPNAGQGGPSLDLERPAYAQGDYTQWMDPNAGPQAPRVVDHGAHLQNWLAMGKPASYDHPDYGGSGRGMNMDNYMEDARRYGSKRMADRASFDEKSADADLKRATSTWYTRRYSGPPRGAGGAGSGTISGMSTRELTTYRNSLEKDIQYAIPGTPDHDEKLDFLSQVDDELQNRVKLNRTPRSSSGAGGGSGGAAGAGDDQAALQFLTQNYPQLKNPTPGDVAWARKKMGSKNRHTGIK